MLPHNRCASQATTGMQLLTSVSSALAMDMNLLVPSGQMAASTASVCLVIMGPAVGNQVGASPSCVYWCVPVVLAGWYGREQRPEW